VIVVLKDGRGRSEADRIATSLGGQVVGNFGYLNLYQIKISGRTEEDLRSAIDRARQDPDVELAFPNQQNVYDMVLQGVECSPLDDPVYTEKGRGKGYEMIGVQKAWDLMRASGLPLFRVAVGVVDDGLFKGNDEFQGKASIDTSDPDSELANPKDQFGSHGTRIMNILAANPDNGGVTGIASEPLQDKLTVSMINKNAFGNSAMGDLLALNESVNKGNKIICCSWGNTHAHPDTVKAFKSFFEKMARDHPDVLFVCSAGNDGEVVDGDRRYPSGLNLPNMITVGNVMNDGSRAAGQRDADGLETSKCNMASANFEVTLAAPGEQAVKGFDNQGNLKNDLGGTSMATPQVAAAAALIRALNPKLNAGEIKEILAETARTSLDIDGKKVAAPPELGGRILAIDEAVLKVVNDLRAKKKLGPLSMEEAIGRARIGLVARNDSASPQEWKVTAEILNVGDAGTDVTIELQGEGAVGGDSKQHLNQPGSPIWDVTAKGSATVVAKRLDTMGCSRVVLPEPAVPAQGFSGKWQLWSIIGGTKIPFCGGIKCAYVLSQSGSSVTLTPPEFFKSQTIVGTINGNTFTGTLRNDDPNTPPSSPFKYGQTHGSVEITFSPDGSHFTGKMMEENWGSELEWEGEKIQETQP
jgi:subtilisin family serine protease